MVTTAHPILPLAGSGEPPPRDVVGGKAHALFRVARLGFAVPPGIVLPADLFDTLVVPVAGPPPTAESDAAAWQERVRSLPLLAGFRKSLLDALAAAGLADVPLAVRSSAVAEDGPQHSFAGQFDSVLGVRAGADGAALWDAIRRVWASAGNARALAYAGGSASRMAVLVQQVIASEVSGVALSASSFFGEDTVTVAALYGLGEALVSDKLEADTFFISGEPFTIGSSHIVPKPHAVRLDPEGGMRTEPVPPEHQKLPALAPEQACRIAATARRLAAALDAQQDIEWALDRDGRLWILQSRPITTCLPPEGERERRIWDNSNIVESYGGVTTPLTFSFARRVYEEVYRQFCRLMGVSEALIAANREVFAGMLGLVEGRIYYNLLNWYRALSLLPGYAVNRDFMERMMGVRQKLADPPQTPYAAGRIADAGHLIRMLFRLIGEYRRLPSRVTAFHARVETALRPLETERFEEWSTEELAALYRRLERELLGAWQTPILNDFFTMIAFGLLGRLVERWLPESPASLANDLLCGEGGMISAEPAARVLALAEQVAASPALSDLFAAEPDDRRLWERLKLAPAAATFRAGLEEYLARFGDRCLNELKLETVPLREDPAYLLRMVRMHAGDRGTTDGQPKTDSRQLATRNRREAEEEARLWLRGVRRALFFLVLREARRRVRDRENLRFERTRVFGLVRRIVRALGDRLSASGRLAAREDVFYLTVDEIFAAIDGTGVTADLDALTRLRRAEFAAYAQSPAPPDRIEEGGVGVDSVAPSVLHGLPCCPGKVRARAKVVRDPSGARAIHGRILVAERTDPGWTLLFPAAAGLLVQRGSLLSHSAIVAREMGLPCIVGVAGLLETVQDEDLIEMDGATGEIRLLHRA